jgi:hypothetical protein
MPSIESILSKYDTTTSTEEPQSAVAAPETGGGDKISSILSKYGAAPAPTETPQIYTPNPFVATAKSTAAGMANAFAGQPIEDIGEAIGSETLQKAGKGVREYAENIQRENPSQIGSLSDILEKPGTAVQTALGNIAPQLPVSLAGALGGARTGAAVGGIFGPVGAGIGAGIGGIGGAFLPNYLQEAAEMRGKQHESGREDKTKAYLTAVPAAGLETVSDVVLGGKFLPDAVTKSAVGKALTGDTLSATGSRAAHVGKQALKGTAAEASTEYMQTLLEQMGGGQDTSTPEAAREREVSAALGGLGGGLISGGTSAFDSRETEQPPKVEAEQPATEATQPAPSELDLRTDAEKAAKPIDLTTPTEDFGEVEQPTGKPPINVPPGGFDVKETEDWLDRFERAWAGTPNGAPRKPTVSLATEAYKLGINVAQDDDPKAVIAAMRAEIEARKPPEQKIAEAATTAAETSNAEILSAYPDGNPGIVGKVAVEANNAGISSVAQEAAAAKEQELAAQQEQVVVDTTTGEVLPAEAPVPASDIDVEAIRNIKDDNMLRNWLAKSEKLPELRAVIQAELDKRAAAVQPQPEVADALAQPETGPLYGGGSEQPSVRGEGERAAVSGEGVPPEGQAIGDIPTAEEVITQPEPIGEANGESTNQAARAAPQEVTPELDAAVANQAAANSSPDDYVPTDSFEDAAAVTLSEQSDKAPEDIAEGKYKKGEVAYKGLRVAIETPAGESRVNKKDPASPYPPLDDHYGEIVGADAIDGDFVDAFSNPDEAAREASKQVFIVDQIRPTQEGVAIDKTDPHTWEYDEAKVMLGYGSKAEAEKAYLRNYEPGWQGLGEISAMSLPNFKRWLVSGKTKEPVAKKVAAPKMESAPKVPVFKVPPRGKVSEPDKRVYRLVADRLGIPTSVVADIDRLSASELQSRNQEGIYPLNSARISEYGGDLRDRYVEYVRLFNPEELTTSEAEDGIKTRQGSNYPQYLAWAKKGVKPPLISVAETESGALQSSSRRRTLAAQEAGKPISGWLSPINRETTYKDPLKYGDILDAIQDVKDDTRTKTVQKTDDLLTTIAKLGGIARKHAEGVDHAAFKDAKAKGDITPVFRVTGGRSLDDLMLVLNIEYGWAFADPNDLGTAVTDALRSGEPVYNAEGSERQAKKQLDEYKSDDQLQAEFEFLADVDAADIPEADKEAFKADILDGDFDPERDRKILDNLIAKYAPAFSRRAAPGQTDLFATTKEEMAELKAKQGVADYAAQKDKRRQGSGAEPPPLFSDYPGFMGQVDIEDKASAEKIPDTLVIDGVRRPTTHSEGKYIHETEDGIRNFWRWFGNSKVVDEQGRPKVVYHGTNAEAKTGADYERPQREGIDPFAPISDFDILENELEFGAHFGTKTQAAKFSGTTGEVYPVYLKAEGLLEGMADLGSFSTGDVIKHAYSKGYVSLANRDNVLRNLNEGDYVTAAIVARRYLREAGIEGLRYLNRGDGVSKAEEALLAASGVDVGDFLNSATDAEVKAALPSADYSYAVFNPYNIKSAIGNVGTFSEEAAEIQFSRPAAKEQSLPDLFRSLGKFDKAPESINHPDAERIRYVQDNFLDLLTELESNKKVEIKC